MAAHRHLLTGLTEREERWMTRAVEAGLDLEAMELVLRLGGGRHVLARKVRLLVCLAEAWPACYPAFVNERRRRLRAWAALARHAFRSALKLAAGRMLLARRGRE